MLILSTGSCSYTRSDLTANTRSRCSSSVTFQISKNPPEKGGRPRGRLSVNLTVWEVGRTPCKPQVFRNARIHRLRSSESVGSLSMACHQIFVNRVRCQDRVRTDLIQTVNIRRWLDISSIEIPDMVKGVVCSRYIARPRGNILRCSVPADHLHHGCRCGGCVTSCRGWDWGRCVQHSQWSVALPQICKPTTVVRYVR